VGDIVCLVYHNILFLHIKHEFLLLGVVDCGPPESTTRLIHRAHGSWWDFSKGRFLKTLCILA
jgi:hypothetical protein